MPNKYFGLPLNKFGWLSFILGVIGSTLFSFQLVFGFGFDSWDKALVSIVIVLLLLSAVAFNVVHFRFEGGNLKNPYKLAGSIVFIGFVFVSLIVLVCNMTLMTMNTEYSEWTKQDLGIFQGFRMLAYVTDSEVDSLTNWGIGMSIMIRALFLTIPFLIVTWGALSALTAKNMGDMQGALFSFIASLLFTIEVWMFRIVDITLAI